MNYKVGDKVRIKTFDDMAEEFGLTKSGYIKLSRQFFKIVEYQLNELNCNRMITIKEIKTTGNSDYYKMEEIGGSWIDDMISSLALRLYRN